MNDVEKEPQSNKNEEVNKEKLEIENTPENILNIENIESKEPIVDSMIHDLLSAKTEQEYDSFRKIIMKHPDFDELFTIFLKNPRSKDVFTHEKKLSNLCVGELIKKCKQIDQFQNLELDENNCTRDRGEFFEVLIPTSKEYDFVIKRLYRGQEEPKTYERNKKYSLDTYAKNQQFFRDYLPKQEIIESKDGQLFVKAEKITSEKNEYIDLNLLDPSKQESFDRLLEDDNFVNDIDKFIKSTEKFYEDTKRENQDGFMPDIAGRNLAILRDAPGKYSRLVYLDTMGNLDSKYSAPSFQKAKELIKLLKSKVGNKIDERKLKEKINNI